MLNRKKKPILFVAYCNLMAKMNGVEGNIEHISYPPRNKIFPDAKRRSIIFPRGMGLT